MTPPFDVYAREVVMARVGHLVHRKQGEVERITRILRGCFDPTQVETRKNRLFAWVVDPR